MRDRSRTINFTVMECGIFFSVSGNVSNAPVNASLKSTVKIRKKMLRLLWQTFNIIGGRNQLAHRKEEENLQVSLFVRLVLKDTPFAGMGSPRRKKIKYLFTLVKI